MICYFIHETLAVMHHVTTKLHLTYKLIMSAKRQYLPIEGPSETTYICTGNNSNTEV